MKPAPFAYHRPASLEEAFDALAHCVYDDAGELLTGTMAARARARRVRPARPGRCSTP